MPDGELVPGIYPVQARQCVGPSVLGAVPFPLRAAYGLEARSYDGVASQHRGSGGIA